MGMLLSFENMFCLKIPQRLVDACRQVSSLNRTFKVDESQSVGGRPRYRAFGKMNFFSLLKRQYMGYPVIGYGSIKITFQQAILGTTKLALLFHSDVSPGCGGPPNIVFERCCRVKHWVYGFCKVERVFKSVVSFWNNAKSRAVKFVKLNELCFNMHLKETQCGFNQKGENHYLGTLEFLRLNKL